MRVNNECVRCVILYLESNLTYKGGMQSESLLNVPILASFEPDDIRYAVKQLYKEHLIECKDIKRVNTGDVFIIYDIEPEGHKFCDLIRDEWKWESSKSKISGLSTIKDIIEALANAATLAGTFAGMLPK